MTDRTRDRHKEPPLSLRPPDDLRAWLSEQTQRRGISRSALIIEALREKRAREEA